MIAFSSKMLFAAGLAMVAVKAFVWLMFRNPMAAVSLRGAGGDELVGAGNAIGAGSTGSLQRAPGFPQSAENSLISHDTHIFRPSRGGPVETLVVYIFSSTDPEYEDNLRFFLRTGIHAGNDYVIIFNQAPGDDRLEREMWQGLEHQWPHVRFFEHDNLCYDWGTFGWLLEESKVEYLGYRYIIMMNSSVRGPFLPAYWPRDVPWTRILTDRLSDAVKLVGPTISCEGSQPEGLPLRKNAHVQSFVVAMDQEALAIIRADTMVLSCHTHIQHTMYYSELGASLAILAAGYNIDSLMLRYQGINWQDPIEWQCNGNESPYKEMHNDGVSLDPLETLFVKVKGDLLTIRDSAAVKAVKYDSWGGRRSQTHVLTNDFHFMDRTFLPRVLTLDEGRTASGKCFDPDYYRSLNPDLGPLHNDAVFLHFSLYGRFEARPFLLKECPPQRAAPASSAESELNMIIAGT